jgi:cytochrome P450
MLTPILPQPGVPHSYLFGHLPAIAKEASALPPDCHPFEIMLRLIDRYDLRRLGCFTLDTYPVLSYPQLVVISAEVGEQVTQGRETFGKHPSVHAYHRVIGRRGLPLLEGGQWRDMRALFNPGFSHSNIVSMMPLIVDEINVLTLKLSEAARRDSGFVKSFHRLGRALTIDIIGRVVLGLPLHSQTSRSDLVEAIERLSLLVRPSTTNFSWERLNLWRKYRLITNERVVHRIFAKLIAERWEQLEGRAEKGPSSIYSKSILDIVLRNFRLSQGLQHTMASLSKDFSSLMVDK